MRQSVVRHVCACLCVSVLLSCVVWIVLLGKAGGINGITFQHTRVAHTHTHMANNSSSNNNSCSPTATTTATNNNNSLAGKWAFSTLCYCFCFVRFFYIFFCIFCYFLPPFVFPRFIFCSPSPARPFFMHCKFVSLFTMVAFFIIEISQEYFRAKTQQRRIPSRIYDKFLSCFLFFLAFLSFFRIFLATCMFWFWVLGYGIKTSSKTPITITTKNTKQNTRNVWCSRVRDSEIDCEVVCVEREENATNASVRKSSDDWEWNWMKRA